MKQKNKLIEKIFSKERAIKGNRFVYDLFLIWCAFSLIASCYLFYLGFHKLDQSRNFLYLSYNEQQTYYDDYVDQGSDGNFYSWTTWYRTGIKQMFFGFHIILFNLMIFIIYSLKFKSKTFSKIKE